MSKVHSWPPNVTRDVECQIWYHKDAKQQSNLCKACTQLKWKFSARKKEHEHLSQSAKMQRSDASSRYPFEYLSPDSKQMKVSNMCKAIVDLTSLVKHTEKKIERLPFNKMKKYRSLFNLLNVPMRARMSFKRYFPKQNNLERDVVQ